MILFLGPVWAAAPVGAVALVANLADYSVTLYASPDLLLEANPLAFFPPSLFAHHCSCAGHISGVRSFVAVPRHETTAWRGEKRGVGRVSGKYYLLEWNWRGAGVSKDKVRGTSILVV
jgi:hypothetical protein